MNKITTLLIIFLSAASFTATASEPSHFGIGGRVQLTNWSGDNGEGRSSFESEAAMVAFNFRFQRGRLYSGVSLMGRKFTFEDDAPDQNDGATPVAHNDVVVERGELDLILGYYFWRNVSLFADIKAVSTTWINQNYSEDHAGIGFGVSGFMPLRNNWSLYASLGFVPITIESSKNEIGTGDGSSLEFGASYRFKKRHTINFGLKTQTQEYEFDNGSKQTHETGGLVAGYNFLIR